MQSRLGVLARRVYHRLPLPQTMKWQLRERFHPLWQALQSKPGLVSLGRGLARSIQGRRGNTLARDNRSEQALSQIMQALARHASQYGPPTHWIALPFLATGGAERVALNLCQALRELRPGCSVALLITDRRIQQSPLPLLPEGVLPILLEQYLGGDASLAHRSALLLNLLLAGRPQSFHNINSEAAWHTIIAHGDRLRRLTHLHASIFAFQFAPDGRTKIGYAAYYLKQGIPHLSSLITDNKRFAEDAITEYALDDSDARKMQVLYQPSRCASPPGQPDDSPPAHAIGKRLRVLWAGRLDREKQIDLFLDIVQQCDWADFHVFGQVVLDGGSALPDLKNLTYEGPFTSPLEWQRVHRFDAFLFTSRWEGLPNILLEAGALGLPIIAPTVGGIGELITTETGFPLAEQANSDAYAQALREIAQSPRAALARAARLSHLIATRHSWAAFIEQVKKLPAYLGDLPPPIQSAHSAPDVSIIIPCYNQGQFLQESITSALLSYQGTKEIIVVDDGSTDARTPHYLADAEALAPGVVRILRQTNQGLSGARNNGVAEARGSFIQFLDADDLLAPGKLDAQVAQLRSNPSIDVSICNFLLCDDSRTVFSKPDEAIAHVRLELEDFLYRWERGFVIPIHCGLFRRGILEAFDTEAVAKEDWLFWVGLSLQQARMAYIHGHWAIYRQHPQSMRRSYVRMGRAWLQAGLKIEARLGEREPIFFESVVSWFEQCYRGNPAYRQEIATLKTPPSPAPPPIGAPSLPPADPTLVLKALNATPFASAPLISVVVPIFNHFPYLVPCLQSLAEQGQELIEIICIDDASTDHRVKDLLLSLTGKTPSLKVIQLPSNIGISNVQNLGVNAAKGSYVAFVDCDDALEPHALKRISQAIQAHPDVDYFFTDRIELDEYDRPLRIARYGGYDNLNFRSQDKITEDLLDRMVASHLKVIRRSAYLEVGGCDPTYSGVQDWDLALKLAAHHRLHYLGEALYRHRIHSGSVTHNLSVMQFNKTNLVRRIHTEKSVFRSAGAPHLKVLSRDQLPSDPRTLRDYWKRGVRCAFDARGAIPVPIIHFLREFNSYFEAIYWNDPALPAALLGYLWRSDILVHTDSIPESPRVS